LKYGKEYDSTFQWQKSCLSNYCNNNYQDNTAFIVFILMDSCIYFRLHYCSGRCLPNMGDICMLLARMILKEFKVVFIFINEFDRVIEVDLALILLVIFACSFLSLRIIEMHLMRLNF